MAEILNPFVKGIVMSKNDELTKLFERLVEAERKPLAHPFY